LADQIKLEVSDEFRVWLSSIRDNAVRGRIGARAKRVVSGLLGHTRSLGGGLEELKLDFGPGYRVYFARRGNQLVVLLAGGDKSTQSRDIELARQVLDRWERRK
jgi:putative addiction module killer protein